MRSRSALLALTAHDDALRLRFKPTPGGIRQTFGPVLEDVELRIVDLSLLAGEEQHRQLMAEKADLHGAFDLAAGPLMKAMHVDLGDRDLFVLVVHHLAIDAVSWPLIVEDLEAAYKQAREGEAIHLPAKTTSYAEWARQLEATAQSDEVRALATQWNDLLATAGAAVSQGDHGRIAQTRTTRVTVAAEGTLSTLPSGAHTQEVLLTALAMAMAPLASGPRLRIDVEGHGRDAVSDAVDVTRTDGWFTSLTPFVLPLDGDAATTLPEITSSWRELPARGSYGLLRFLTTDSPLDAHPDADVLFNYLGAVDWRRGEDALFQPTRPLALSRHPELIRPYAIEVNAWLMGGELQVEWEYGPEQSEAEIQTAADTFVDTLRALASRQPDAEPDSGFSLLKPGQLDQIAALLGGSSSSRRRRLIPDGWRTSPTFIRWRLPKRECSFTRSPSRARACMWSSTPARCVGRCARRCTATCGSEPSRVIRCCGPPFCGRAWISPFRWCALEVELPWTDLDWTDRAEEEQARQLEAFLKEDRAQGFELARAPLMRMTLIRTGAETHQFVWSFPPHSSRRLVHGSRSGRGGGRLPCPVPGARHRAGGARALPRLHRVAAGARPGSGRGLLAPGTGRL